MTASLAGKTALVTGASRGIGRAIAEQLAAAGALVAVHYGSNETAAEATVAAITASGGTAFAVASLLDRPDGPGQLFAGYEAALRARTATPWLDILINNAGVGSRQTIAEASPAEFDRVMAINLRAPFFVTQKALSLLRDGGRIINVTSTAARIGYAETAIYTAVKAALEALTISVARYLGPRNITVNAVAPGATVTDINPLARDPVTAQKIAAETILGRVGQPSDIAAVVAFLASDEARWITGQVIEASGGLRL